MKYGIQTCNVGQMKGRLLGAWFLQIQWKTWPHASSGTNTFKFLSPIQATNKKTLEPASSTTRLLNQHQNNREIHDGYTCGVCLSQLQWLALPKCAHYPVSHVSTQLSSSLFFVLLCCTKQSPGDLCTGLEEVGGCRGYVCDLILHRASAILQLSYLLWFVTVTVKLKQSG